MAQQGGHITFKVILGYFLLVLIAVGAVVYVYNVIERIAVDDEPDTISGKKIYLVTNTLSLLYESEALGQLIGVPEKKVIHFNRTLDKALQNMDSLRMLVTDPLLLSKIDTIDVLIERKRRNTSRLLETWNEANADHLYTENIQKVIAEQDTVVKEVEVQERVIIKQDSVIAPRKSRGFFKRLAEVFVPVKEDSAIVVNTTRQIVKDTLVNAFNPSDTITSVLRNLQDSVAGQRRELVKLLLERAANLGYDNSVITSRINQMLRNIEEDEMEASLEKVRNKQKLLKETSLIIAVVAIVAFLIVVFFIFLITRDLSRSKYYRLQLEKAKQYAEDLLHRREKLMLTISHDIRAPLSSILGYIELLLHRNPDERQRYYLENMTGSSRHILSLVNDLLDFHRLESGKMQIQKVPYSIPALSKEIYDSFRIMAEAKGLEFILNLKEEGMEGLYLGDPIRIRQVIGNLLSNAIKFTSEGRVVLLIKLIDAGRTLSITVSDSGPGIPVEEQERIFAEFTRLAGVEKEEGFGLGLSITRKLIELMGGKLSLNSQLGKRSDFTIVLPLEISDIRPTLPTVNKEEEVLNEEIDRWKGKKICCLLIDDDPFQLALTEEFLKRNRVEVMTCTQPASVLSILRNASFDAVITDIQMPGMDGYQLLHLLRSSHLPGMDTIPVIALSASVEKEHTHYVEAGFTAFLNKPFTAGQLLSLLHRLLSTPLPDFEMKEEPALDFSSLTAFAGEDKEASATIIRTFTEETTKSISLLKEAKKNKDTESAAHISHKSIPLFTMLGAVSLVEKLRKLEKPEEKNAGMEWEILITEVITEAEAIVKQALEIYHLSY